MTDAEWPETITDEWKIAASSNSDDILWCEWHRQDDTAVEVWVIRLAERDDSLTFSLRAATWDPDALIEYNAYEIEQNEAETISRRQAELLVHRLTTALSGDSDEGTSSHLRLEDTIRTSKRHENSILVGSLQEYFTTNTGT